MLRNIATTIGAKTTKATKTTAYALIEYVLVWFSLTTRLGFLISSYVGQIITAAALYLGIYAIEAPIKVLIDGIITLAKGEVARRGLHIATRICLPLAVILGVGYAILKYHRGDFDNLIDAIKAEYRYDVIWDETTPKAD